MDKSPVILGIESSCDETAVAVVNGARDILANVILSQKGHAAYGGVVPEVAARGHLSHMDALVREALAVSGHTLDSIDAVAVTAGPGLIGGVLVGAVTAKAIAAVKKKPLLAINHLEGHALTARLTDDVRFPYLLLLVSGGHCQILLAEGVGRYRRLGGTIDDAVGEAFDKTAKIMGLGYPGGPAVEKMAAPLAGDTAATAQAVARFPLPRPLLGQDSCDFSFSGLKTAVKRMVDAYTDAAIPKGDIAAICLSFQQAVADILADRVARALDIYMAEKPAVPTLVVAGGVAANKFIGARLGKIAAAKGVHFVAPPLALCTDNAAMIAWAGVERYRLGLFDPVDFPVYPRWPLDPVRGNKAAWAGKA